MRDYQKEIARLKAALEDAEQGLLSAARIFYHPGFTDQYRDGDRFTAYADQARAARLAGTENNT